MTFLATIFKELANDSSWHGSGWDLHRNPLNMARLALMVVEEMACNLVSTEAEALKLDGINPDDYHNVQSRVEEAEND